MHPNYLVHDLGKWRFDSQDVFQALASGRAEDGQDELEGAAPVAEVVHSGRLLLALIRAKFNTRVPMFCNEHFN